MAKSHIEQQVAFIYAFQAESGGPVKVGQSVDPEKRAVGLGRGTASKVVVLGARQCHFHDRLFAERYAHALLWPRRVRGEWFDVEPEQALAAIRIAVAQVEAGRLPPGQTERQANGYGPRRIRRAGFLDVLSQRYTADEVKAVLAYRDMFDRAANEVRSKTVFREETGAVDMLSGVHRAVADNFGKSAVTLLVEVIGKDHAILDLPGSHRQGDFMRSRIKDCLPIILALTDDLPGYMQIPKVPRVASRHRR